jgi:YjbE family integral membrane protein
MLEFFQTPAIYAFFQVIAIDLVLAGDNAVVIGLAAAGLPKEQRNKAILLGIIAATVLRIVFALATTWLLQLGPLLLIAGGALLLWVCWKMWRELRAPHEEDQAVDAVEQAEAEAEGGAAPRKSFRQAALQIVVADVSMSLDNVLAVAGAAMDHPYILIFGLGLSIALMGLAATFIARLLNKHRWIAYIGLAIILYVAFEMLYKGAKGQGLLEPDRIFATSQAAIFMVIGAVLIGLLLSLNEKLSAMIELLRERSAPAGVRAGAEPRARRPDESLTTKG